jgi:hypothetical protein
VCGIARREQDERSGAERGPHGQAPQSASAVHGTSIDVVDEIPPDVVITNA